MIYGVQGPVYIKHILLESIGTQDLKRSRYYIVSRNSMIEGIMLSFKNCNETLPKTSPNTTYCKQHVLNTWKHHLNTRKDHLNTRKDHLNTRKHHLNTRKHHLNTRKHHLNTRKHHLNARKRHLNTRKHHLNTKKSDEFPSFRRFFLCITGV